MDKGWRRLGEIVRAERTRLWRSRKAFAQATGVGRRTLDDLELARRDTYTDVTLARIEAALGWQPGTCRRIVGGGAVERVDDARLSRIVGAWPLLSDDARDLLADLVDGLVRRRW